MKNKGKIIVENLKSDLSGSRFLLIFLLLICFNLYGTSYLANNQSYIDGFFNIVTNGYYLVCLFGLVFLFTLYTFDRFEKNQFFIIRCQNRKEYLKQLLVRILINDSVLFFINLVMIVIGLNLFASGGFEINHILDYSISNLSYLFFYLSRLFFTFIIINMISVCLLKLINDKVVILLNLILSIVILVTPYKMRKVVDSLFEMYWIIADYLRLHYYSTFRLEVLCSTIYVGSLFIAFLILQKNI